MHHTLLIESTVQGLLFINGQFCGPMEREGQAFPSGQNAEIYIQLFPFSVEKAPLTAALILKEGQITRLEPQENCFALLWPDGVIQLELRMPGQEEPSAQAQAAAHSVLARYLTLRLAGDLQAAGLWLRPQDEANAPDISVYSAVVPLRFAPLAVPERYDDRAGLVRRIAPNVAEVDAALAMTSPAGQGHRLIERIDIFPI